MSNFEDHLWSHLVSEHRADLAVTPAGVSVARRGRRRPFVLAGGGVGLAATAAAVTVALTSATAPAFAVTDNPNGSVTVTLNQVQGITGLNAELAQDKINAKAIPVTATCSTQGFLNAMPGGTNPSTYTITIVPSDIPAGYTGIVAVSENASGQIELAQGAWPSPGPSCMSSTALSVPPAAPGS
jgi:hypothetical protein